MKNEKKPIEIKLSATQLTRLQASQAHLQKLIQDREIINAMINQAANNSDALVEIICDANGLQYQVGIKLEGDKLILPS